MQGVGSYLAMPSIRKSYPHTHGFPARSRAVPRPGRAASRAGARRPPSRPASTGSSRPTPRRQSASKSEPINPVGSRAAEAAVQLWCGVRQVGCRLRLVVLCLCYACVASVGARRRLVTAASRRRQARASAHAAFDGGALRARTRQLWRRRRRPLPVTRCADASAVHGQRAWPD